MPCRLRVSLPSKPYLVRDMRVARMQRPNYIVGNHDSFTQGGLPWKPRWEIIPRWHWRRWLLKQTWRYNTWDWDNPLTAAVPYYTKFRTDQEQAREFLKERFGAAAKDAL